MDVDPATGLSSDDARSRQERYGRNTLGEERDAVVAALWDQIANAVVVLLIGAAVAGFAVGEVIEAVAIVVVLVVNTIVLCGDTEALPRGGEHVNAGAVGDDRCDQRGGGLDDVLAVVEQGTPVAQRSHDRRGDGVTRALDDPQRVGDDPRDVRRCRNGRKLDKPRGVVAIGGDRVRRGQGELRLADPTGPDQRHDRRCRQRGRDLRELRDASDQVGAARRQVAA